MELKIFTKKKKQAFALQIPSPKAFPLQGWRQKLGARHPEANAGEHPPHSPGPRGACTGREDGGPWVRSRREKEEECSCWTRGLGKGREFSQREGPRQVAPFLLTQAQRPWSRVCGVWGNEKRGRSLGCSRPEAAGLKACPWDCIQDQSLSVAPETPGHTSEEQQDTPPPTRLLGTRTTGRRRCPGAAGPGEPPKIRVGRRLSWDA